MVRNKQSNLCGQNMNTEKKPRSKGGKGLTSKMAELGYRPREIVHLTGTSPQVVYGWMQRGVSARYANKVADILKCLPAEISDSLVAEAEIADSQTKKLHETKAPPSMSFAPVISWGKASSSCSARDHSNEWAVCVLMDELPFGCFALLSSYTPSINIPESSGMVGALFVDPIIDPACKSQYGHIVQTPSMDLPAHRKIERNGGDAFLVGMDPKYPVPPQPLTPDCVIIGTVISVGIAKASPFAFP